MSEELNPYQTPKAKPMDSLAEPGVEPAGYYVMVSTKLVGQFCKVLLGLFCLLCALLTCWSFKLAGEYDVTDEYEGFGFFSFDQMCLIEEGYLYLFLGSIIAVSVWKIRSMKNAWAMMRSGIKPTVSPGWAVGWYFVPVAMFWKPFTAMSEINANSTTRPKRLRLWLGFWWGFWLIAFFIDTANDGEQVNAGFFEQVGVGYLLNGAAGGCLLRIITFITEHQMKELNLRKQVDKKRADKSDTTYQP